MKVTKLHIQEAENNNKDKITSKHTSHPLRLSYSDCRFAKSKNTENPERSQREKNTLAVVK